MNTTFRHQWYHDFSRITVMALLPGPGENCKGRTYRQPRHAGHIGVCARRRATVSVSLRPLLLLLLLCAFQGWFSWLGADRSPVAHSPVLPCCLPHCTVHLLRMNHEAMAACCATPAQAFETHTS